MWRGRKVRQTIVFGLVLRVGLALLLSTYENVYAQELVFTDIDYKVYSDAAVAPTPYDRHTYRYTPLLAYLMAFNYSHHDAIGKIILALFDAIAMIVLNRIARKSDSNKKTAERNAILLVKMYAYNPLFIALTVRGSCESISLALMYGFWLNFFGGDANGNQAGLKTINDKIGVNQPNAVKRWAAYALYGLWVHFRVYPIVLLPLLLAHQFQIRGKSWGRVVRQTVELAVGAGGVFVGLGALFYWLYGNKYLDESYLYHLVRRDHRHSFSPYFYETYLTFEDAVSASRAFIRAIPTIYILISSLRFLRGYSPFYLHFLVTFAFVSFNRVITLQYYMWVFGALLLALPESIIMQQGKFRMGWGLLLQWALPVMIWVWLSLRLEGEGENHLHVMWMICLFQVYMHLWVVVSFMKTVRCFNPEEERKRKLEEAKRLLAAKNE